jgi:hypothetical protein
MNAERRRVYDRRMLGPALVDQQPLESIFSLNGHARYIHEGWFVISVANLVVIVAMIVVFVLALVLPFPRDRELP